MTRRIIASLCTALLLGGCATTTDTATEWRPTVDPQRVNHAKYETDLAECRQLAQQTPGADVAQEKKKANRRIGIAAGATMAVATVMTGGAALVLAPMVLGAGAIAGASQAGMNSISGTLVETTYKQSVTSCLLGRGYHVIGG